jgi:hypothetical protein
MRPSTEFFKKLVGNKPVNLCELGVAAGTNAWVLYNHFKVKRLWLIDSWCQAYNKKMNKWIEETFKKFDGCDDVVIIKGNSIHVSDLIPDNSLDYLYIDDLHSADHVKRELDLYFPKMKKGSIISGHDMDSELRGRVYDGIVQYTNEKMLTLLKSGLDWWFIV